MTDSADEGNEVYVSGGDRREFFRLDDSLKIQIREVPEEVATGKTATTEDWLVDNFTVMSSLSAISAEMAVNMRRIEVRSPDIAAYLHAIDRKIEVLGRAFLAQESELVDMEPSYVNISAGGVALHQDHAIEAGAFVEVKMMLFPSFTGILTYGKVLSCSEVPEEEQFNGLTHLVRVKFKGMREIDQDMLIGHIMRRQTEQLRARQVDDDFTDGFF